jgi:hypothetical protein
MASWAFWAFFFSLDLLDIMNEGILLKPGFYRYVRARKLVLYKFRCRLVNTLTLAREKGLRIPNIILQAENYAACQNRCCMTGTMLQDKNDAAG